MAEPVSSIITIATVSTTIIKETIAYIKHVQLAHQVVDRLRARFEDLHKLIKLVETTYSQVDAEEDNEHLEFIRNNLLLRCRDRLRHVHEMLCDLASKETSSFIQKAALKWETDKVKDGIEAAMGDIHAYMEYIRTVISL
ncbi:hypothetical protein NX059_005592 [Plenodomus lindquistii]|nr:hypothetical protein NX059_005592 [Plenodomus lindquistii]